MQEDKRLLEIKDWIESDLGIADYQIETASADASFRRYFRLSVNQGGSTKTFIIMDAPPEKEDCQPFVKVARLLEGADVHAPHIFEFNEAKGFMRLSDLGNTAYLDQLNDMTVDALYADAIKAMVKMQSIEDDLPLYDNDFLHLEMNLFKDWYLEKHLNIQLDEEQSVVLDKTFNYLAQSALSQKQVFVHRDYHSRNLMITEENNPGVIDFQDAMLGSACYDLVSLIKDCYISWPRDKLLQWINIYLENSPFAFQREDFIKSFDLMGLQRHIKVAGIFARLNYRDGKPRYLDDIPLVLAYIFDVCERYPELDELKALLNQLGISPEQYLLEQIQ